MTQIHDGNNLSLIHLLQYLFLPGLNHQKITKEKPMNNRI